MVPGSTPSARRPAAARRLSSASRIQETFTQSPEAEEHARAQASGLPEHGGRAKTGLTTSRRSQPQAPAPGRPSTGGHQNTCANLGDISRPRSSRPTGYFPGLPGLLKAILPAH